MAEKQIVVSTTAQDLTTNWVDLGDEVDTTNFQIATVWLDLDINDSENARVRVLAKRAGSAAGEYEIPIYTPGTTDIGIEGSYYEWTTDEDQKTVLQVNMLGMVQSIQIQIQCGVVGATAGQIESCYVHMV